MWLSSDYYTHFLSLSIAMNIILSSNDRKRRSSIDYAKKLLQYFVVKEKDLYGPTFTSYSVIHLPDDVVHFDIHLYTVSCFPFENHLQIMKKFVRSN